MGVPYTATKGTLLELVMLALTNSPFREHGLDALRAVLKTDPRLAILENAFNLQPIWELLEGQEGFTAEAATPPMCFVKSLEDRLGGLTVTLPGPLAHLGPMEIVRNAAACPAKRDEADKIIATTITDEVATAPRPATAQSEQPSWTAPGKRGRGIRMSRGTRLALAITATVLSLGFLAFYVLTHQEHTPSFTAMDPAEFAGELPLTSAEKWASEVHAVVNPAWLSEPEDVRRRQLTRALERLSSQNLGTLIIEDASKKVVASAQWLGQPPRATVQVRFY